MKTYIQSTSLATPNEVDFKSQVYSSIDEYFSDLDRAGRDENHTRIKGQLWPRSSNERNQILIDKIKAKQRLGEHSSLGGSELMLSI